MSSSERRRGPRALARGYSSSPSLVSREAWRSASRTAPSCRARRRQACATSAAPTPKSRLAPCVGDSHHARCARAQGIDDDIRKGVESRAPKTRRYIARPSLRRRCNDTEHVAQVADEAFGDFFVRMLRAPASRALRLANGGRVESTASTSGSSDSRERLLRGHGFDTSRVESAHPSAERRSPCSIPGSRGELVARRIQIAEVA